MKTHLFLLIFFCGLYPSVHLKAQNKLIDSLQEALATPGLLPHDKVLSLAGLAEIYSYQHQEIKSDKLLNEAVLLAEKNHDPDALTEILSIKAGILARSGKMLSAKKVLDSCFYYSKHGNVTSKGIAWERKGYLQNIEEKPDSAIASWQIALNYLTGNSEAYRKASIYYLMFGVYANMNDSANATHYARLSLEEALKSGSPDWIVNAWQIMGTDFSDRYQRNNDPVELDSALYSFHKAIQIYEQQKDRIRNPGIVRLPALYLADLYLTHFPDTKADTVLKYIHVAMIAAEISGNPIYLPDCYMMLAKLAFKGGKLDMAEKALLKEKEIVDSLNPPSYVLGMSMYGALADVAEKKGNLKEALVYKNQYIDNYTKLFNQRQSNIIHQLNARYQSEKKDHELELLKQKDAFHKRQNYWYLGIALIAIAGLLFLFRAYHFKVKYSIEKEHFLQQQKEEAFLQAKLKAEEAARLFAEQQLTLVQNEHLQKEVLASNLQVEHKNEVLQNLKDKLTSGVHGTQVKNIEKIIHEEMRMDEDFDNVKSDFTNIHPEFFSRLQQNARQKLTHLDLKYCAYLYMRVPTKQIAGLLHVEPKSVRMNKYRLKIKFGLQKEDDLESFIQEKGKEK